MVMQKAAVNWGKCWNSQNLHVLGHSNLSKGWSCTYLLTGIQRVCATNSNEAGLKKLSFLTRSEDGSINAIQRQGSEPFQ